jgi:hypothetical protein
VNEQNISCEKQKEVDKVKEDSVLSVAEDEIMCAALGASRWCEPTWGGGGDTDCAHAPPNYSVHATQCKQNRTAIYRKVRRLRGNHIPDVTWKYAAIYDR